MNCNQTVTNALTLTHCPENCGSFLFASFFTLKNTSNRAHASIQSLGIILYLDFWSFILIHSLSVLSRLWACRHPLSPINQAWVALLMLLTHFSVCHPGRQCLSVSGIILQLLMDGGSFSFYAMLLEL